ncbi:MAG: hypothetical protein JXB50_05595, partial [Spirochaetes bacterium]|nr:hypothetical protein [Spirochaetota bacterium]
YSNFMGHGCHGMSLMRSFFGFNVKPVKITGFIETFPVQNHTWREGEPPRDSEKWQHAIIEYDNGSMGIFNFTSLTYGSPMRVERNKNQVNFYAEKGMGLGHDLVVIRGMDERVVIPVQRNTKIINNTEVVTSYKAQADFDIEWENPFCNSAIDERKLGVALCLRDLMEAIKDDKMLPYGALNARLDRETELAMEESASNGSTPVFF